MINIKLIKLGFTSKYSDKSIEKLFLEGENFLNNYICDSPTEVCHYFPTNKIKNILGEHKLLFSDVEFLNDLQEESNIFLILKELLEGPSMKEIHPKLISCLSRYDELRTLVDNEIVYSNPLSLEQDDHDKFIYNSRRYIFCASKDTDCLAMWKYYSKGDRYDALNIVFSPNDLINCIVSDLKEIHNGLRIVHGSVIYDDNIKKEILVHLIDEINRIYINYLYDNDRNSEIQHEIVNHFFYLLKDYSAFFKNESYKHEQEYRFVLEFDNTNIKKYNLEYDFRHVGAYQMPYMKIGFEKDIVKMLVINPNDSKDQLAIKSNRAFLDYYGYNKTDLGISTIPLRY